MSDEQGTDPRPAPPPAWRPPDAQPSAWTQPSAAPAGPGRADWPEGGQPPRRSNRRAIIFIGVLLAVLAVALIALVVVLGSSLGRLGAIGQRTPIDQLAVGQCFDGIRAADFDGGEQISPGMIFGVEVVDCAEEHEGELIARLPWPGGAGAPYPGDEQVQSVALRSCSDAFASYVGISYDSSRYEMTYTYPQQRSWSDGARNVECIVHPPLGTEQHAGSVRGTER